MNNSPSTQFYITTKIKLLKTINQPIIQEGGLSIADISALTQENILIRELARLIEYNKMPKSYVNVFAANLLAVEKEELGEEIRQQSRFHKGYCTEEHVRSAAINLSKEAIGKIDYYTKYNQFKSDTIMLNIWTARER